jgi:hypothetical protein
MARSIRSVPVVGAAFLVGFIALFVAGSIAQTPEPEISRSEWGIGDWWEFSGNPARRLTVIAREGDYYVLARSARHEVAEDARGRMTYHSDGDGWITKTMTPDGKTTENNRDKWEYLRFPLRAGSDWTFSVRSGPSRGVGTY